MIRHHQVKPYHRKPETFKQVEKVKVSEKLHMIHHWNGLDLDITDFKYHHDPTELCETIPSQTSNP